MARLPINGERAEMVLADLMDLGTDGVVEGDGDIEAHFPDRALAERCAILFGGEVVDLDDRNWAAEWQAGWKPVEVGARFFLAPAWCDDPTPDGRIRLEMRPGLVFGGGDHATTQFCLELLEDALQPGCNFADVGSGSGILALAARELGARSVVGCDLSREAAEETLRVGVACFEGSVDAMATGSADVVAANLPTGVLLTLMPEFARVLKPGGRAVLSGFLLDQREMLFAATAAAGWTLEREIADEDWAAARLKAGD